MRPILLCYLAHRWNVVSDFLIWTQHTKWFWNVIFNILIKMPWLQQTRLRSKSFKHFHILAPAFCRVVQACYRLLTWRYFHKYAQAQSLLSDFSLTKPNSLITIYMRDTHLYVILTMCYNQLLPTHEQAVLKYPTLCGPSIQKIFVYFNLHFFREKILHLIIWLKLVHVMKHSALTVYIVTRSQLGLYAK